MATETDRLARAVIPDSPVQAPTLLLRMGEIKAVHYETGLIDLTLGGAGGDELVVGVPHLSNYRPQLNEACWVLVNGKDLLALDRTSIKGPSVISDASSVLILTEGTRTATSFGNLATIGPAAPTAVNPSGRLMVQMSCFMSNDNSAGGAVMGVEIRKDDGTHTRAPEVQYAQIVNKAGAGKQFCASHVAWFKELPPGLYTVTAKYACLGTGTARFRNRVVTAIPL